MQEPRRSYGWHLVDCRPKAGARAALAFGHRMARRGTRPVELPLVGTLDVLRTAPSCDGSVPFPLEAAPAPRMPDGQRGVAPILERRTGRSAGLRRAAPGLPDAYRCPLCRVPRHAFRLDGEEMRLGADAGEAAVRSAEPGGLHKPCVARKEHGPARPARARNPQDVGSAKIDRAVGAERYASTKHASAPPATDAKGIRPGGGRPIGDRVLRRPVNHLGPVRAAFCGRIEL